MAKSKARKEYERVYRNAKAKERRLKNNHGVSVDMALLTPSEWQSAPNKKREIRKLDSFTERDNRKYDYVSLGKESIKRSEYQEIASENKKVIDKINYHKKKVLKRVIDKPFMVYNPATESMIETAQNINDRTADLQKKSLKWQGNHSHKQNTKSGLKRYQKEKKAQLKALQKNSYAQLQKTNYINKLDDFSRMFKGTSYQSEHKKFMNTMKKLSPEDYEAFYYLSDIGDVSEIPYISDDEIGTPEGQEKIYRAMKSVQIAWKAVEKLLQE